MASTSTAAPTTTIPVGEPRRISTDSIVYQDAGIAGLIVTVIKDSGDRAPLVQLPEGHAMADGRTQVNITKAFLDEVRWTLTVSPTAEDGTDLQETPLVEFTGATRADVDAEAFSTLEHVAAGGRVVMEFAGQDAWQLTITFWDGHVTHARMTIARESE